MFGINLSLNLIIKKEKRDLEFQKSLCIDNLLQTQLLSYGRIELIVYGL